MNREQRQRDRHLRQQRLRNGAEVVHGRLSTYNEWGCRCEDCKAARAADAREKYQRKHAQADARDIRDQRNRKLAQARKTWQSETNDGAWRRGEVWTGPELELAARTDLTIREIALMIGRTWAAVRWARKSLQVDPRKAHLAGLPTDKPQP